MRGKEWVVGSLPTPPGTHVLKVAQHIYFACYLYGYRERVGYMHPAGFRNHRKNVRLCANVFWVAMKTYNQNAKQEKGYIVGDIVF